MFPALGGVSLEDTISQGLGQWTFHWGDAALIMANLRGSAECVNDAIPWITETPLSGHTDITQPSTAHHRPPPAAQSLCSSFSPLSAPGPGGQCRQSLSKPWSNAAIVNPAIFPLNHTAWCSCVMRAEGCPSFCLALGPRMWGGHRLLICHCGDGGLMSRHVDELQTQKPCDDVSGYHTVGAPACVLSGPCCSPASSLTSGYYLHWQEFDPWSIFLKLDYFLCKVDIASSTEWYNNRQLWDLTNFYNTTIPQRLFYQQ